MRSRYVYAFKHIITLVDKYLQQQGEAMSRKLLHEVRDVLKQSNAIEPSADALATVSNKLRYYSDQIDADE
jgi:hypothetical protein